MLKPLNDPGGPNDLFTEPNETLSLDELSVRLGELVLVRIAKEEEIEFAGSTAESEQCKNELRKIERLYGENARLFQLKLAAKNP